MATWGYRNGLWGLWDDTAVGLANSQPALGDAANQASADRVSYLQSTGQATPASELQQRERIGRAALDALERGLGSGFSGGGRGGGVVPREPWQQAGGGGLPGRIGTEGLTNAASWRPNALPAPSGIGALPGAPAMPGRASAAGAPSAMPPMLNRA